MRDVSYIFKYMIIAQLIDCVDGHKILLYDIINNCAIVKYIEEVKSDIDKIVNASLNKNNDLEFTNNVYRLKNFDTYKKMNIDIQDKKTEFGSSYSRVCVSNCCKRSSKSLLQLIPYEKIVKIDTSDNIGRRFVPWVNVVNTAIIEQEYTETVILIKKVYGVNIEKVQEQSYESLFKTNIRLANQNKEVNEAIHLRNINTESAGMTPIDYDYIKVNDEIILLDLDIKNSKETIKIPGLVDKMGAHMIEKVINDIKFKDIKFSMHKKHINRAEGIWDIEHEGEISNNIIDELSSKLIRLVDRGGIKLRGK